MAPASGLLLVLVVAVGAGLRIWQYAAGTSLWLDEIALVRPIVDLDLFALLTAPLPHDQVAPKGFLLVQKLAVTALGPSDYALRLFPFVCSLASLAAFCLLSLRILHGVGPLAAASLFATAAPLVMFSGVAKQYSTDVCVAVLMSWLAYEVASRPVTARRAGQAAVIGAGLVWLSLPGVLMAVALGVSLALWLKAEPVDATRWRRLAPILTCWGASVLAVTAVGFASLSPDTREYLRQYWAAGFAPDSLSRALEIVWPWDRLKLLFGSGPGAQAGLAYPLSPLYPILTAIGFGVLSLRNRRAAVILMAPVVVTLGAALAQLYPFSDRLILFLVPSFFLAIGAAVEAARRVVGRLSRPLGTAVATALVLPGAYPVAVTPPAYRVEHVKAVLSHVQARWHPDDAAYVYYGAAPVVTFYASRYGLAREEYAVGGCHRGDGRRYLQELETFRGRPRVWVVLTHALRPYREREDVLAYLDEIGTRKEALVVESSAVGWTPLPAEAYLYDLSSAFKLARSSAGSFRLTGPSFAAPGFGCEAGPQAMIPSDFRCSGPPDAGCTRRPEGVR